MFKRVKKAIDEFDPFDLLPHAPSDEYENESREIAGRIKYDNTVEEIAEIIADVFSKSFNEKFEIKHCMKPAGKYISLLVVLSPRSVAIYLNGCSVYNRFER